jgi:hypothetical protein
MSKGSGTCDRSGISLEAEYRARAESEIHNEIGTALELQRTGRQWWTKDARVTFQKRKEGWVVDAYSYHIYKAFEEYGIISPIEGEHTYFPSLKAAQSAVSDVSLEIGLNIDSRLTRQRYLSYKVGDLPLAIKREQGHWRVYVTASLMSPNLEKHFNNIKELLDSWKSTGPVATHYPTRKAAHQAVTSWLAQTITIGK